MTDWLEELLQAADVQVHREEPTELSGLLAKAARVFVPVGASAVVRSAAQGDEVQFAPMIGYRSADREMPAVRTGAAAEFTVAEQGGLLTRERYITPAELTPEALDRAIRRDSRRYDGGMSIY